MLAAALCAAELGCAAGEGDHLFHGCGVCLHPVLRPYAKGLVQEQDVVRAPGEAALFQGCIRDNARKDQNLAGDKQEPGAAKAKGRGEQECAQDRQHKVGQDGNHFHHADPACTLIAAAQGIAHAAERQARQVDAQPADGHRLGFVRFWQEQRHAGPCKHHQKRHDGQAQHNGGAQQLLHQLLQPCPVLLVIEHPGKGQGHAARARTDAVAGIHNRADDRIRRNSRRPACMQENAVGAQDHEHR